MALLTVAAIGGLAQTANAQYMYLDSNANGVHDAGDVLNGLNVATTVDIWLNTNTNRNGSTALCDTDPATLMTINSYAFNLQASGGTVTYSTYVNQQAAAMPNQAQIVNPGDGVSYKNGFFGTSYIAAGLYRLGTLTITGATGSPVINFVDLLTASVDFTSFGTQCFGNFFDNTYKLDGPNTRGLQAVADWFDADGLASAAVGNSPPTVTNPGNKSTDELVNLAFTVVASDTDVPAQTLTYSLTTGAPAATGATIAPATGAFSWTPTEAQGPGVYPVTVTATDNGTPPASGTAAFLIQVNEVNTAPVVTNPGNKVVNELANLAFTVTATDTDIPASTDARWLGKGTRSPRWATLN